MENERLCEREKFRSGYTDGKRSSTVSFMFHNFPNSWGMGNLWMLFKKYGTVFDMFMVQKRLRNRHKHGFVRFKNIEDVELLDQRLRRIQIRNEYLRVYLAYDRHEKTTKSIVGEVRAIEYFEKLSQICEEKGCFNADLDHGLRRWIHKLRLWDEKYRTVRRLTWISIMGVPIMCWKESVFSNIAKWHGNVIEFSNCKLEGNQTCITGRVLIHTGATELIREKLQVKLKGKTFRVSVIEVSDVVEGDIVDPKLQDEEEIDAV
nr:transposon TX1 [Tanacetum cinerariifolium]